MRADEVSPMYGIEHRQWSLIPTGRCAVLVLSRRVGQEILIGDIRLVVVSHDGKRVRLAIQAPQEVKILRAELIERPPSGGQVNPLVPEA